MKLKEVIPRYSFFDDGEEKEIYHQKAQKNFLALLTDEIRTHDPPRSEITQLLEHSMASGL